MIPIVLQHLLGQRDKISVFGTDYDTPDGTCIRDYIHVTDLAKAHILALEALLSGKKKTAIYNLGNGLGYSVKEVIETCEKVTGRKAVIEYTDRRPGDPARLAASPHLRITWLESGIFRWNQSSKARGNGIAETVRKVSLPCLLQGWLVYL